MASSDDLRSGVHLARIDGTLLFRNISGRRRGGLWLPEKGMAAMGDCRGH